MSIPLELGLDVVRNYKRLPYKVWYALAEFIDNSTQSFFNNRAALEEAFKKEKRKLEVSIVIDKDAGLIRVSDTAMGMSYAELQHALKIGQPPAIRTGRSQFGMGLKTAAFWFGDRWSIRTKKLGDPTEHFVTVDMEEVARGHKDLPYTATPKPLDAHYTIVEITSLNMKVQGRMLNRTKDFLGSMYRTDIRDGILDLNWQNVKLPGPTDLEFMKAHDGTPYKKDLIGVVVDGKPVTGWIGILGPGSSGRPNAGFTIIRRGRVIRGWPDSWRPESIFGQMQGSNDLINQRIAGEIRVDDFEVSHTKDDILWSGEQNDELQDKLKNEALDYIAKAKSFQFKGKDARGPTPAEQQAALDELRTEMASKEFVDVLKIDTVPPPEVIEKSNKPMMEAAKKHDAQVVVTVGDLSVKVYLATDASPNDLYYNSDATNDVISVVVNPHHPHWTQLAGTESVLTYLRQCVYDAIAEWKCRRQASGIHPATIKQLKDALLRLPSRIEQAADAEEQTDENGQFSLVK